VDVLSLFNQMLGQDLRLRHYRFLRRAFESVAYLALSCELLTVSLNKTLSEMTA